MDTASASAPSKERRGVTWCLPAGTASSLSMQATCPIGRRCSCTTTKPVVSSSSASTQPPIFSLLGEGSSYFFHVFFVQSYPILSNPAVSCIILSIPLLSYLFFRFLVSSCIASFWLCCPALGLSSHVILCFDFSLIIILPGYC